MDANNSPMLQFSFPTLSTTPSKRSYQMVPVLPHSRTTPEEESIALVLLSATSAVQMQSVQQPLLMLLQSKTISCRTFWVRRASWVVASMSTTGSNQLKTAQPEPLPIAKFAISREQCLPLRTRTPSSRPPTTTSTLSSTTGTPASPVTTTTPRAASTEQRAICALHTKHEISCLSAYVSHF